MNIGFIILCRYSSKRLPGKILKLVHGKPLIQYILERLQAAIPNCNMVVATSDEPSDDPIVDYCLLNKVPYFRGSLHDVSRRFLDCIDHFNFDFAFRINGDNLLGDIDLIRNAYNLATEDQYEFISNVDKRTYPKGMSIEGVKAKVYRSAIEHFTESDKEHVMTYFYRYIHDYKHKFIYNHEIPEISGLQMAVDTMEDLHFVQNIISNFSKPHTEYSLKEVAELLKKNNLL